MKKLRKSIPKILVKILINRLQRSSYDSAFCCAFRYFEGDLKTTYTVQLNRVKILGFLLTLCLALSSHAQEVQWLTWEEAVELSQTQKKKFFVDIYTDWCSWCKKMDQNTFSQPNIVEYLNENYYSIKFDAEMQDEITIGDNTYRFVKSGKRGFHELAFEITRGRLSYPTVVFLDEDMKIIQSLGGYWNAEEFKIMLSFFAENHYRNIPWSQYQRQVKQKRTEQLLIPVGDGGRG